MSWAQPRHTEIYNVIVRRNYTIYFIKPSRLLIPGLGPPGSRPANTASSPTPARGSKGTMPPWRDSKGQSPLASPLNVLPEPRKPVERRIVRVVEIAGAVHGGAGEVD